MHLAMQFILWVSICVLALHRPSMAQDQATPQSESYEWLKGSGHELELRLKGKLIFSAIDLKPNVRLTAALKDFLDGSQVLLEVDVRDGAYEVWIPANRPTMYGVDLTATDSSGLLAHRSLNRYEFRQAAVDGTDLQLKIPDKFKSIVVQRNGVPIANAQVQAVTSRVRIIRASTGIDGTAKIGLIGDEALGVLTAWTDDRQIGGYQFWRMPKRDQNLAEHVIDLLPCRSHRVVTVDVNGVPVPNVRFNLSAATPQPDHNFISSPDELAVSTDGSGIAEYAWFPEIPNADHSIQILNKEWLIADQKKEAETTTLVLKPNFERKRIQGLVTNPLAPSGGICVEMESRQSGIKNRSDVLYSVTDTSGHFYVDVLPNAMYSVFVSDRYWVSQAVQFIPITTPDNVVTTPELVATDGHPVRVIVTSGEDRLPISGVQMGLHSEHDVTWIEKGKTQHATSGRGLFETSNEDGLVDIFAPEGKLEITASIDDWRAKKTITVDRDYNNVVELHRDVDEAITVNGRLIAPDGAMVDVANAAVKIGAIDGKSSERSNTVCDVNGEFTFKTKARKLGLYASTTDGKAAGTAIVSDLSKAIDVQLFPKRAYRERLVTADGVPIANQRVIAAIRIRSERNAGDLASSSFEADEFQVITDEEGIYVFPHLPCSIPISILVDPIFQFNPSQQFLGVVSLRPDENTSSILPPMKRPTKASTTPEKSTEPPSISKQFNLNIRDCRLNDFHMMVIVRDQTDFPGAQFVEAHLMKPKISSYIWLQIDSQEIDSTKNKSIVQSLHLPSVERGRVFACAYDISGKEVGRMTFDPTDPASIEHAKEFSVRHAPATQDAMKKWDDAFRLATASSKRVWVRVSQNFCGPCFALSRWMDNHREVLEKDYVFLKIDPVRDLHGKEVAEGIVRGKDNSIPFHAIFDASKEMIIDSCGPSGNIGFMNDIEGKQHFKKMLDESVVKLSNKEVDSIIENPRD